MSLLDRVSSRYLRRIGYRPPIGDWSGYQTFVAPDSESVGTSTENSDEESRSYVSPAQSKIRTRGLPRPSEHPAAFSGNEGRIRYKPYGVLNGPDSAYADQGATKVPIRTLGVPGETYGHPYKLNIYPRRTASEDIEAVRQELEELYFQTDEDCSCEEADCQSCLDKTAAKIDPTYPTRRQRKQKGKSKREWKKYYRSNKTKLKQKSKLWYKRNKRNTSFRRKRELYRKNPKRFKRRETGGYHTPRKRSKDWRKKQKKSSIEVIADTYLASVLDGIYESSIDQYNNS